MTFIKKAAVAAVAATFVATGALADGHATTKLRIQTHYAPETVSGKLAAQYIDDIQSMSGGGIQVEMFYSSSVVKSVETFAGAVDTLLDLRASSRRRGICQGHRQLNLTATSEVIFLRLGAKEFRAVLENDASVLMNMLQTVAGHLTGVVNFVRHSNMPVSQDGIPMDEARLTSESES